MPLPRAILTTHQCLQTPILLCSSPASVTTQHTYYSYVLYAPRGCNKEGCDSRSMPSPSQAFCQYLLNKCIKVFAQAICNLRTFLLKYCSSGYPQAQSPHVHVLSDSLPLSLMSPEGAAGCRPWKVTVAL